MQRTRRSGLVPLLFLLLAAFHLQAGIGIRVYSMDEALNESNISKPRIYIENTGTEAIQDFKYYYYFTVESGKSPVLDDYYTPNSSVQIEFLKTNEYRVVYDFNGVSLEPGQILPNPSGNVIGLHYSDWSNYDKFNDFSFNGSAVFLKNTMIPVYMGGQKIYGNEPGITIPDDTHIRVMPQQYFNTAQFCVFGTNSVDIKDRVLIKAGSIASMSYVETGCDAIIGGNIVSGGNVTLRERSAVDGNVIAEDGVAMQNGVAVAGTIADSTAIHISEPALKSFSYGEMDISIPPDTTYTLNPGSYRDIHVFSRVSLYLTSGVYRFRKFVLEPDVVLHINIALNGVVELNVEEDFQVADRTQCLFSNADLPLSFQMYSNQSNTLRIGTDCTISGFISAPYAELHVNSRTSVTGALHGKKVVIEPDVTVCKPPVLKSFSHSAGAFAPPFSPYIFQYACAVPAATETIFISPIAEQSTLTVAVNGGLPSVPVVLESDSSNINITVSGGQCESESNYSLTVKRDGNYAIRVNDDSPCSGTDCDGKTWPTAYKDLQQALDEASKVGKEIWIAEGVYRPTKLLDTTDTRSSTFLVKSGNEIIGGFLGDEENASPKGSPYRTILSGDLQGNDSLLNTWPPLESEDSLAVQDNSYHVVTIKTTGNVNGITMKGLTITGGIADGKSENSVGAGIFCFGKAPILKECIIKNNIAVSSGAGIYAIVAPDTILNCLIQNNTSLSGRGAGAYFGKGEGKFILYGSVFEGNVFLDTLSVSHGSGLYAQSLTGSIFNSIFSHNNGSYSGGAIYAQDANVEIVHSTFSLNSARVHASGLFADSLSSVRIYNSIFWNIPSQTFSELAGKIDSISNCCVRNGYPSGNSIISSDPLFINAMNPAGQDSIYGTSDDGLMLSAGSPCRGTGLPAKTVPEDIRYIERNSQNPDLGAYAYINSAKANTLQLGKMYRHTFVPNDDLYIIPTFLNCNEVIQLSKSGSHRVIKAYIQKDKYTKPKTSIVVKLCPVSTEGIPLETEIDVKLYKVGEEDGLLVFQSITNDYQTGKKFLFVANRFWHGVVNPYVHIIYMPETGAELRHTVMYNQFQ